MNGPRGVLPDQESESTWRRLGADEFATQALEHAERWLAGADIELRDLLLFDDALVNRLEQQRAARRRMGAAPPGPDLRPLCYLMLMVMNQACEKFSDHVIAQRGLRLAGLHALFCLMASETIQGAAWELTHRLFDHAGRDDGSPVDAALQTTNDGLYLQLLMMSSLGWAGFSARQIDKCFEWLGQWCRGVPSERAYDQSRHYFYVDLKGTSGLARIDAESRIQDGRFFAHALVAERVAAARADYLRQISVTTLELYAANPLLEYHDALNHLNRYWEHVGARHAGRSSDRQRMDEIDVSAAVGFGASLRTIQDCASAERWTLTDLSPSGAGFRLQEGAPAGEKGALVVFSDPQKNVWVLASVVRIAGDTRAKTIGVRRLSSDWRLVQLQREADSTFRADDIAADSQALAFYIFGDEARGLADSMLVPTGTFDPAATFVIIAGTQFFRIRLGRVIQSGLDWERVGFEVLKRPK